MILPKFDIKYLKPSVGENGSYIYLGGHSWNKIYISEIKNIKVDYSKRILYINGDMYECNCTIEYELRFEGDNINNLVESFKKLATSGEDAIHHMPCSFAIDGSLIRGILRTNFPSIKNLNPEKYINAWNHNAYVNLLTVNFSDIEQVISECIPPIKNNNKNNSKFDLLDFGE